MCPGAGLDPPVPATVVDAPPFAIAHDRFRASVHRQFQHPDEGRANPQFPACQVVVNRVVSLRGKARGQRESPAKRDATGRRRQARGRLMKPCDSRR